MNLEDALKAEVAYDSTSWTGQIGGVEVTLYAKPITPKDTEIVSRKHQNIMSPAAMTEMVALKARDENGKLAFGPKLLPILKRAKTSLISDIFVGLFSGQLEDETEEEFEERLGN